MLNWRNPRVYLENFLYIRNKQQKLQKLTLKPAQENLYRVIREEHQAGRPVRLIVLKGRQEGISTVTEGLMFQDAATRPMVSTLIVAHTAESTATLFKMNKLFFDCLPPALQPMRKASNAKELLFENPTRDEGEKRRNPGLRSKIRCTTAGSGGIGRSDNFNNVHLSEFAFWPREPKELLLGIMQAVPDDPNTVVVIESTANGYNYFQELWSGAEAGTNGWRPVFLPWYMEPEYRRPVEPGTEWTAAERELAETWHLDEEQLAWRRWCVRTNCGGDERLFRQEYPNTPDEAFLLSGESYFDNDTLSTLRRSLPPPARVGEFTWREPEAEGGRPEDWRFTDKPGGYIRIYREPEEGVPYVLGGDTAGEGSDRFTAFVIDNRTGEQVAELQQPLSEIYYARQVYCLGMWYNQALAGIEINYSTYPELKLEEWGYPRLYQRERFDTFAGKMVKAYGWATTAKTRPQILAGLHTVTEEAPELIRSFETLGEMLVFVYGPGRKPQAAEGQHDDLVMAAAICHQIRSQQRTTRELPQGEARNWTADMWEDWRSADEATRRLLEQRWGRPKT